MKYVAYYRVSTQKQGLGLEAQQIAAHNFLNTGDEIISEYSEKESGKNNDRPELAKALQECSRTGAVLLIAKLDRLSRNVEFLFSLKNSGRQFKACDCPELDTLTLAIFAGMAQRERELISARTKAALQAKKARGERIGNHNAKFTDEMRAAARKQHSENARSSKCNVMAWACIQSRLTETLEANAQFLNAYGYTTPRGGRWSRQQVKNLIAMYQA